MDLHLIKNIVDQCADMMIKPRLHLSGLGEPLISPDIDKVMALCFQKKIKWSITTNGLALKKYARDLVVNNCRDIHVSLHGTSAEHEKITSTEGSYQRVIKGLEALSYEKEKYKKAMPRVVLNCVINNNNVSQLKKILDSYLTLPVNKINFQHLSFTEQEMDEKEDHLMHDKNKFEALFDLVHYIKKKQLAVKVDLSPRIKEDDIIAYYTDKGYPFNDKCVLPWLSVRVLPDGEVQMCNQVLGNLRLESLKSVINSRKAVEFRKKVMKGEFRNPDCLRCCHRQYY